MYNPAAKGLRAASETWFLICPGILQIAKEKLTFSFSKCDFWNLWNISVRHRWFLFWEIFFFRLKKKRQVWKNIFEIFRKHFKSSEKNQKFQNFESKFWNVDENFENLGNFRNFEIFFWNLDFFSKNLKIFFTLFSDFFRSWKKSVKQNHLCQSEIFQRFQKSHLENRLMSLNMRKLQLLESWCLRCQDWGT